MQSNTLPTNKLIHYLTSANITSALHLFLLRQVNTGWKVSLFSIRSCSNTSTRQNLKLLNHEMGTHHCIDPDAARGLNQVQFVFPSCCLCPTFHQKKEDIKRNLCFDIAFHVFVKPRLHSLSLMTNKTY